MFQKRDCPPEYVMMTFGSEPRNDDDFLNSKGCGDLISWITESTDWEDEIE